MRHIDRDQKDFCFPFFLSQLSLFPVVIINLDWLSFECMTDSIMLFCFCQWNNYNRTKEIVTRSTTSACDQHEKRFGRRRFDWTKEWMNEWIKQNEKHIEPPTATVKERCDKRMPTKSDDLLFDWRLKEVCCRFEAHRIPWRYTIAVFNEHCSSSDKMMPGKK